MQESEALKLLNIPRSTLKEWSKPEHAKHKLYLLIKNTDAKRALQAITQSVPTPILTLLNRNIKEEELFTNDEIFKLFSKKSYAKLTPRERVAFAKLVRELDDETLTQLFSHKVTTPKAFLHLFNGSAFAKLDAFSSFEERLTQELAHV
jgi:succinate dehydrogenase flavin-adding protein (antitoxin of CptAB toxin-antitoxin module)